MNSAPQRKNIAMSKNIIFFRCFLASFHWCSIARPSKSPFLFPFGRCPTDPSSSCSVPSSSRRPPKPKAEGSTIRLTWTPSPELLCLSFFPLSFFLPFFGAVPGSPWMGNTIIPAGPSCAIFCLRCPEQQHGANTKMKRIARSEITEST